MLESQMPAKLVDILLVEDNPADVRLAQETLKDYKLQNTLHVVHDGESALAFLRHQGKFANAVFPDMVLLDLALPKIDGMEVLEQIRRDERLRDLPVVILTASPMDQRMLENYNLTPDCCILKPLTLERYLEAVRCFPEMGLSIVKVASI
jgi:two-component system, chemotaxis family, response regulator Rcp1